MTDLTLIEPKEFEVNGEIFTISKFPSTIGREIVAKYPISALPKLGDYEVNQETMLKLMSFVKAPNGIRLDKRSLIDNHVKSWEDLVKLEMAMLEYNCSFLQDGRASNFLDGIAQKLPQFVTKILTGFLERSSPPNSQQNTN